MPLSMSMGESIPMDLRTFGACSNVALMAHTLASNRSISSATSTSNHSGTTTGKTIGDQDRFEIGMKNAAGRRLTYKELTGKELPGVGAATSH